MRILDNNKGSMNTNQRKSDGGLDNVQDKHPKVYHAANQIERIGRTIGNKIDSDLNLRVNQQYIHSVYNLDCADHICVRRLYPTPYTHHGLYLGLGFVIHYDFSHVCIVTLEEFAKGQPIFTVNSPIKYPPEEVMVRAMSRIGEEKYNLITNNCEHFVRWCRNGAPLIDGKKGR